MTPDGYLDYAAGSSAKLPKDSVDGRLVKSCCGPQSTVCLLHSTFEASWSSFGLTRGSMRCLVVAASC